jgi:hypothetical protein
MPSTDKMRHVKLSRSQSGRIGAGKAWFNMTSEGGVYFTGKRALYSDLFMFENGRLYPVESRIAVYRPGVTPKKALATIGGGRLHKRRVSGAIKRFKEKMILREGALLQRLVQAYVRDPNARRQCIAKYGTKCSICKFSFKARYGKVAEGLIHVHHVRQLSDIRKEHRVNPVRHLRPVCPNCHAVLHLANPAYSIERVRSFLRS